MIAKCGICGKDHENYEHCLVSVIKEKDDEIDRLKDLHVVNANRAASKLNELADLFDIELPSDDVLKHWEELWGEIAKRADLQGDLMDENTQLKQGYTAIRNDMARLSKASKKSIMDVNSLFYKNGWDAGRADAADEIERLREELKKSDYWLKDTQAVSQDNANRAREAEQRIEELETALKSRFLGDYDGTGHYITDEQIRAAVEYANALWDGTDLGSGGWVALNAIGFERCGHSLCDGRGRFPAPWGEGVLITCPDCHGIGAVRIEEETDDSNTNTR